MAMFPHPPTRVRMNILVWYPRVKSLESESTSNLGTRLPTQSGGGVWYTVSDSPSPLGRPSLNPRPDRPEAVIIVHSNDYCSGAGSEDSDSLRNLNYTVDCVCV